VQSKKKIAKFVNIHKTESDARGRQAMSIFTTKQHNIPKTNYPFGQVGRRGSEQRRDQEERENFFMTISISAFTFRLIAEHHRRRRRRTMGQKGRVSFRNYFSVFSCRTTQCDHFSIWELSTESCAS
jgi:hypothetical protein